MGNTNDESRKKQQLYIVVEIRGVNKHRSVPIVHGIISCNSKFRKIRLLEIFRLVFLFCQNNVHALLFKLWLDGATTGSFNNTWPMLAGFFSSLQLKMLALFAHATKTIFYYALILWITAQHIVEESSSHEEYNQNPGCPCSMEREIISSFFSFAY